MRVEYSSNNSGGGWWLSDEDWQALEDAGWNVAWAKDDPHQNKWSDGTGRWLGALATRASIETTSMTDAIRSWEAATGHRASALGCSCCGPPHSFSGDGEYYSPSYPEYGDDYY